MTFYPARIESYRSGGTASACTYSVAPCPYRKCDPVGEGDESGDLDARWGRLLWSLLIGLLRSRASLEAENLALRQQIIVLRRTAPKRRGFNNFDRLIIVGLYRLLPGV